MMKKYAKLMSMVLAVCILMTSTTTVFAARGGESGIMPQWSDVSTITSSMEVDKWGIASISATGKASTSSSADTVEVIAELQKYENDDWNTIKTWTDKQNVRFAGVSGRYAIAKGYKYQLYITVKAYKGSKLLETATDTYYYGTYN